MRNVLSVNVPNVSALLANKLSVSRPLRKPGLLKKHSALPKLKRRLQNAPPRNAQQHSALSRKHAQRPRLRKRASKLSSKQSKKLPNARRQSVKRRGSRLKLKQRKKPALRRPSHSARFATPKWLQTMSSAVNAVTA